MTKDYNKVPVKDNMKVDTEEENVETNTTEEKPKMKKVVNAEPQKVKKSLIGRLAAGVLGPEGVSGIGTQVNEEIIKPAIKNIIFDAITSGLSRALNLDYRQPRSGGHVPYNRGGSSYSRPSTNYSSRYSNARPADEEPRTVRPARHGVEEYVIADRYDAAHVLTTLRENADMYDTTSIADYYDLIGVASQHTDNNYGWTVDTLGAASIIPVRGGYVIKFPPVEVI